MELPSQDGAPSLPPLSLFSSFIFFLPVFEDNDLLFWVPDVLCQHSEVVWRIYSALKCSFDEFVREKVVSLSYSSTILGLPLNISFYLKKKHSWDPDQNCIVLVNVLGIIVYIFNLYAKYIMRNAGLEEAQAGIKTDGRNINYIRYAGDTTLMAESE